jgi:hypothetical protein
LFLTDSDYHRIGFEKNKHFMTNSSKNNAEESSVIFLHIPKAAGTTLHRIIEQQYEPNTIFTIHEGKTIIDFKNLSEAQRARIRVLKGHLYFGLHEFLPRPSTYITMVRDPIERVISHYYFELRTPSHELYKKIKSQNMSLEDFVRSGVCLHLDNGQTRLLSTTGAGIGYGQCSNELLESAKKNLREHFAVVGLVERFDETLILLKRKFKWKMPFYIKQNVTKQRPLKENIPKDTLKLIESYNQLDIELYKYTQKLFEELINQQPPLFELELKSLKLFNQTWHYYYKTTHLISSLVVSKAGRITTPEFKNIREINFKATAFQKGYFRINGSSVLQQEVCKSDPLTVSGWAVIADEIRPADKVIITYGDNNSIAAMAPVNLERPDVVKVLKNPAYKNSGWSITLNLSTLSVSKLVLKAWAYNSVCKEATPLKATYEVVILD